MAKTMMTMTKASGLVSYQHCRRRTKIAADLPEMTILLEVMLACTCLSARTAYRRCACGEPGLGAPFSKGKFTTSFCKVSFNICPFNVKALSLPV
jgi:hypothetical protein